MHEQRRFAGSLALLAGGIALIAASNSPRSNVAPKAIPAARTAIHQVRLFDGMQFRENATVVFSGGVIESVCTPCDPPSDARVIDGRGKTLLPGLIDAHTHVFRDALERALVFGVTTEIDMFTSHELAASLRAEQKAGKASNRADLISAGTLVTVAGGHGTEYGVKIPTFAKGDDAQRFVDERIAEGSDFIKIVLDDGKLFDLDFDTLDAASLRELIAAAHARRKLAVVHVSTAAAALVAVDAGADGLVHAWSDVIGDDALFDRLVARKVFVIPTLSVIASIGGEAAGGSIESSPLGSRLQPRERAALKGHFPSRGAMKGSLDRGREIVRALRARGVIVLAGTDAPNPGTTHGASMHSELSLLVSSGLSPTEALRAATSVPAATFGLSDRGTIAKGKRADLLLVGGDASRDISVTRDISAIWKGGVAFDSPPPASSEASTFRGGIVSDFETHVGSAFGTDWIVSTDAYAAGKSVGTIERSTPGANGNGALRVAGEIRPGFSHPWSGAMLFLATQPMDPVDLRPLKMVSFRIRGDSNVRLMLFSSSTGPMPASYDVTVTNEWRVVQVPLQEFGSDGSDVQALLFSGTTGAFSFELDDVAIR